MKLHVSKLKDHKLVPPVNKNVMLMVMQKMVVMHVLHLATPPMVPFFMSSWWSPYCLHFDWLFHLYFRCNKFAIFNWLLLFKKLADRKLRIKNLIFQFHQNCSYLHKYFISFLNLLFYSFYIWKWKLLYKHNILCIIYLHKSYNVNID